MSAKDCITALGTSHLDVQLSRCALPHAALWEMQLLTAGHK